MKLDANQIWIDPAELFRNGELALQYIGVSDPHSFALIFNNFAGDVTFKGYPSISGSSPCLSSGATVSILRDTDSPDGAWSFVQSLYSKETQSRCIQYFGGFSLNREVLDSQIEAAKSEPKNKEAGDVPYVLLSDEGEARLRTLLESMEGTPEDYQPEILAIVQEEAAPFFEGQKSAGDVAKSIQSRVEMLVKERG